ncbi:hypothetical protein TNCV_1697711 [Trichonephila clavipes]|nr:hypothetical protein TNCV_1697711 [Trichonephila clavipes]
MHRSLRLRLDQNVGYTSKTQEMVSLIAGSTGIGKGTTFVMARFKIPVEVFTLTTLTRPSLPGNTSRIRPIGQSRAWCWDPLKRTS